MKAILSLIISSALVVSGYSQTRNVLVGTNNTVVQPTNFWSADASNARAGLGLGSAATNPASAFQPSSAVLSNLAAGGGAGLTNIAASNIVGTLSIGQGGTGATNASDARTALGLGTAATNAETAFQPSSTTLSNLSLGNGGNLTNLQATSLVGQIPASNIASVNITNFGTLSLSQGGTGATNAANARQNLGATTVGDALFIATNAASARTTLGATTVGNSVFTAIDAAAARTALSLGTASTNSASAFQPSSTVLSNLASSNAANLINLQATNIVGAIPASNIPFINLTNITGTLAIASGGTGATNAGGARTNLGLGAAWLTNNSVTNFRTAIELGATNSVSFHQVKVNGSIVGGSGFFFAEDFNIGINLEEGWIQDQSSNNVLNWSDDVNLVVGRPIVFGTNASIIRTNLGLGAIWLTNTNVTNFRTAIGLGQTNDVQIGSDGGSLTTDDFNVSNINISGAIAFTNAATTRTNLGLGWPALTNSNAGTGLVSVNTNGIVVSPTNFWQVAPIQTLVQDFTGITVSQTNNATNARNVYVYSLATNVSGISNTIILPTNTSTFNGDEVTVIHKGTTNTTTAVRQAGSTNNLITINKFDESIKFIREFGQWNFYYNNFAKPIQFSGNNSLANAAESRTNLGVPSSFGTASNSIIAGGISNVADVPYASIFGGQNNIIDRITNFVGWNFIFEADMSHSIILGGKNNTINNSQNTVIGPITNQISGSYSTIVNGENNFINGSYSTILNGMSNTNIANFSLVGGVNAKSEHAYSFVWSDGNAFSSTNTNSFNVSASGGMSLDLGTNGIMFRNNNGVTNTRKSILPSYQSITYTTNTNSVVTTNTNLFSGKVLAVNSNATDVEWVPPTVSTNSFTNSATFVIRTNSTSRSNTSTAVDEVLTYSFPSAGKYFVTLGHLMTVETNSGLKAKIFATNATVYGTWSFGSNVLTNDYNYSLTFGGQRMFHQWFIVDADTNSSVAFGWSQVNATNTTSINAGSFMRIEKAE